MTGDEARAAILAHLDRIDRAERIFIYDKEGYASRISRARALGRWWGIHPAREYTPLDRCRPSG